MEGTEATSQSSESTPNLDSLLGGEAATEETSGAESTATESTEPVEETTESETTGDEAGTEEEPAAESGEESEAEAGEEGDGEEEGELSFTEEDRDYSQAAYERAAKVYSKNLKRSKPFDPNDPDDRATLRELMQRKEGFERLQSEAAAREAKETAETSEEETKRQETERAKTAKPTAEQIKEFISNSKKFAPTRVINEVAADVADEFRSALAELLWPGEELSLDPIKQDTANKLASIHTRMLYMGLEDALPALFAQFRGQLSADPVIGRVESMAVREAAFEKIDTMRDAKGMPLYPNLEKLVDSGALKKAMDSNKWIGNIRAGDGRDPVQNYAAQLEAAIKIARGEAVNPEVVSRAVQTGKKQEADRAKKLASGRVPSGKTKGVFGKSETPAQKTVSDITGGSGSKFSSAIARDLVTTRR